MLSRFLTSVMLCALLLCAVVAPAQKELSASSYNHGVVRDIEIEYYLNDWLSKLASGIGSDEEFVVFLMHDPAVNAFATTNQRIFMHSGIMMANHQVEGMLGVLAHEAGHILSRDILRGHARAQDAQNRAVLLRLFSVLGGIVMPPLLLAGGALEQINATEFYADHRHMEASADEASLKMLEGQGLSAKPMYDFWKMQDMIGRDFPRWVQYYLTHPMSHKRAERIALHMKKSRFTHQKAPKADQEKFERIQAKLIGYYGMPIAAMRPDFHAPYGQKFTSKIATAYIGIYRALRDGRYDVALKAAQKLQKTNPKDVFVWTELAQIHYMRGEFNLSAQWYEKALRRKILSGDRLTRLSLARALLKGLETVGVAGNDGVEANSEMEAKRKRLLALLQGIYVEHEMRDGSHISVRMLLARYYGGIARDRVMAELYLAEAYHYMGDEKARDIHLSFVKKHPHKSDFVQQKLSDLENLIR